VLQKNKNHYHGFRSGFTLIELVIVMGVLVVLMTMAMASMGSSRKYFNISTAYEKVVQMVRETRSYAVTGKANLDWTDYDQDGLDNEDGDLVTPAGYGIYFDTANKTVTLFADVRKSSVDGNQSEGQYNAPDSTAVGVYQAGRDVILERYTILSTLTLIATGGPYTIIYTPIFADTIFYPALNSGEKLFIFGASEGEEVEGMDVRHMCSKMHLVSGVPEKATDTECPYTNS